MRDDSKALSSRSVFHKSNSSKSKLSTLFLSFFALLTCVGWYNIYLFHRFYHQYDDYSYVQGYNPRLESNEKDDRSDVPISMNLLEQSSERLNPDKVHLSSPPILTAYLYSDGTQMQSPIYIKSIQFPEQSLSFDLEESQSFTSFPAVDLYPDEDPYLPWIHDVFVSQDGDQVHILAQNRRRCHTGKGNENEMLRQEPQIALLQPIWLQEKIASDESRTYYLSNHDDASVTETRFICNFKVWSRKEGMFVDSLKGSTFSRYLYNYEYIAWRKKMKGMFAKEGKEMTQFWLSSLEFICPVPEHLQMYLTNNSLLTENGMDVYLDIGTIRTPTRQPGEWFFHSNMTGHPSNNYFDVYANWGTGIKISDIKDTTRWENILLKPIQRKQASRAEGSNKVKPFTLVACTWTSAAHNRRGDAVTLSDGRERLREWIAFNLLVGFDHVVVYDNTAANTEDAGNATVLNALKDITDQFGAKATYVNWPPKICNNNRPAHSDPGERSSQYAAEASCRARFGPLTEWMTFLDPDEYLVPMGNHSDWKEILHEVNRTEQKAIIKFRSTRARPRPHLMEETFEKEYGCPSPEEVALDSKGSCLSRKKNETFLKTYNCDYIKSPKPDRFQRAMVSQPA